MIIGINEKQEVIFTATGLVAPKADNVTTFEVVEMPAREANKTIHFNPETKAFYITERPAVSEEVKAARKAKAAERREKAAKKAEALKWFSDNDWKVNKRVLGEWAETDERWIQYLEERRAMRAQYDEAIN